MSRTIHRFWAGPKDIPIEYIRFGQEWARLNPTYTVVTWNEQVLEDFPDLKPIFDDLYRRDAGRRGIELYVQMADVIGYALIERHGGVYVNCDMQPVKPLSDLPEKAWASYENYSDFRIVNAAIGAPAPHDPFWQRIIEGLPARYFANPTAEMVETTGPAYLTDMANAHMDETTVLPKETFNPVHWGEIEPGGDASAWLDKLPENTIAVHHWGHKKDGRTNTVESATQ